ncbi:MAG TPA: GNAT family N-acetyltransferase [Candidatus Coprovivens excrementavium]|nr:GNAT family N-acetyltransferase [Candidatus Coprovivens excrementavium]
MEKFYLEIPSVERKNEIIDYIKEFAIYHSDTNGMGALDKILEGYTFEQALDMCLKLQDEVYAKKLGRCQSKTFLLIREDDDRIVGAINVRWNLIESMKEFGGNIGYGIRPTERRKGYNKINLYLALIEAYKLGLEEVILDCDVNNLGSVKTLEALNGKLKKTAIDPYDGVLTSVYWFDVNETIRKYKDIFKDNISEKESIKK